SAPVWIVLRVRRVPCKVLARELALDQGRVFSKEENSAMETDFVRTLFDFPFQQRVDHRVNCNSVSERLKPLRAQRITASSLRTVRLKTLKSVTPVSSLVLFPGLDRDWQPIFFWRQRAGGVSGHGARWTVSPIEVEQDSALHRRASLQESSSRISFSFAGWITEDEEEFVGIIVDYGSQ